MTIQERIARRLGLLTAAQRDQAFDAGLDAGKAQSSAESERLLRAATKAYADENERLDAENARLRGELAVERTLVAKLQRTLHTIDPFGGLRALVGAA